MAWRGRRGRKRFHLIKCHYTRQTREINTGKASIKRALKSEHYTD